MEIYFQLVTDAESLKKAVDELKDVPFLGFDVETTELDPYKGDLRLVQLSDGKNTKVIDLRAFAGDRKQETGDRNRKRETGNGRRESVRLPSPVSLLPS